MTPLARRSYLETTDQEMDVWIKLKLHSPSPASVKTISFTVTPVMPVCGVKDVGYRQCGPAGYCVREQFYCDGQINCINKQSPIPPGSSSVFICFSSPSFFSNSPWFSSGSISLSVCLDFSFSLSALKCFPFFFKPLYTLTSSLC